MGNKSKSQFYKTWQHAPSFVCKWVKKAWDGITVDTIKKSFQKAKLVEGNIDSSDFSSNDDEDDSLLDEDILTLFNSESDEPDFSGFK